MDHHIINQIIKKGGFNIHLINIKFKKGSNNRNFESYWFYNNSKSLILLYLKLLKVAFDYLFSIQICNDFIYILFDFLNTIFLKSFIACLYLISIY